MDGGKFITLEGGEGAGKSTLLGLLAKFLRTRGLEVLATREPGGAPGAAAVRRVLVEGAPERWDPTSEALLHFAARRAHLVDTVWQALAAGNWVLSDRFADSTMAYQGYGHGLGREPVEALYRMVVGDFAPHLTLILDLPPDAGLARAAGRRGSRETRYERLALDFHERLRHGYLDIARREPRRCVVVDATRPVAAVQDDIQRLVAARFDLEAA